MVWDPVGMDSESRVRVSYKKYWDLQRNGQLQTNLEDRRGSTDERQNCKNQGAAWKSMRRGAVVVRIASRRVRGGVARTCGTARARARGSRKRGSGTRRNRSRSCSSVCVINPDVRNFEVRLVVVTSIAKHVVLVLRARNIRHAAMVLGNKGLRNSSWAADMSGYRRAWRCVTEG